MRHSASMSYRSVNFFFKSEQAIPLLYLYEFSAVRLKCLVGNFLFIYHSEKVDTIIFSDKKYKIYVYHGAL